MSQAAGATLWVTRMDPAAIPAGATLNVEQAYTITKKVVKAGQTLKLTEAPGGGFAISLIAKCYVLFY